MEHLAGCSVLEVGEYVAVPYAGKLLASQGATVTKVEPPDGDVSRHVGPFHEDEPGLEASQFFGYLNTDKRSVTVPPADASSADVVRGIVESEDVDVVVEEDLAAYGVDAGDLAEEFEDLTVVSVTGFGLTGPYREDDAPEVVAAAESGHMNKAGYPDRPPTRPRIQAIGYWTGQLAAIAGATGIVDGARNGASGTHIDLSRREAGTSSLERYTFLYSKEGETTTRTGFGYPDQNMPGNMTIFETADGYVSASIVGPRWETFVEEFLERPELMEDERFVDRDARRDHREEMYDLATDHISEQETWPVFEKFQEHGFPSAVTMAPDDIASFEHLHERDFWEEVPLSNGETVTFPGFPNLYDGERPSQGRAPRLGEHTAEIYDDVGYEYLPSSGAVRETDGGPKTSAGGPTTGAGGSADDAGEGATLPLEGIKVLDFSWVYAGPHATRMMSALGADVVKISSENQYGTSPADDPSAYFMEMGLGKRSITLNMNVERGRDLALDLVAEADVVVETYSPGYAERIGLDYETLSDVNPEIVFLSMPGWGRSGPARSYRSYGLNIQSMAGLDYISGFPDDPPTTSGMSWPDPVNAYFALFSVLSALTYRERTGEGRFVESPLLEAAVSQLHKPLSERINNDREPERVGNRDEDRRYVQGAYPCAGEDRWTAIAVETDAEWARLCEAMGRPELADDPRFASQRARLDNHDAVDDVISEWTRDRSREEVRTVLQARDVPAGMVNDEADLIERDPQMRVRDYFNEFDHPDLGELTYQGFPFRSARHDLEYPFRTPSFGEHTDEVLDDWLGLTESDVEGFDEEVLY